MLGSCSDTLTENNIFQSVTTPEVNNGTSSGNVWGYNYTINEIYTGGHNYSIPARNDHAAGSDMNLTEGNVSDGVTGDVIHGTGNMMTFFRNYYSVQPACWTSGSSFPSYGYGDCNSGITTAQIYSFHRFYSLIGNVLGTTGSEHHLQHREPKQHECARDRLRKWRGAERSERSRNDDALGQR